jgi:hypothetical protein
MTESVNSDLRLLLESLRRDASQYFHDLGVYINEADVPWRKKNEPEEYWGQVTDDSRKTSQELIRRSVRYSAQLAEAMRNAPLVASEDLADLRVATKTMGAALQLRQYRYFDIDVLHDEGRVLGVRPASQSDDEQLSPLHSNTVFSGGIATLLRILSLVDASADLSPPGTDGSQGQSETQRYRPGTAFVMMWMDPSRPELVDVCDAVKETFNKFGIKAIRADDIEHDGQITQRVLNELMTSEFLFADLSGSRPNVYYEVGFAHAIGRRVIMYRSKGEGLHFDLAGYNCPEYINLSDLKVKLSKRLEEVTSRKASNAGEV